MGEGQGSAGEAVDTQRDRTPDQIREEIAHTRVELGDTVAALAAKTDVKAQAHRAVDNAKATVTGKAREVTGKAREVTSSAGARRDEIATTARAAMPPSADAARRQVITLAQEHRLSLLVLAAFTAGLLIGRRRA
jgi:Protein of unknown function (DUF3618)